MTPDNNFRTESDRPSEPPALPAGERRTLTNAQLQVMPLRRAGPNTLAYRQRDLENPFKCSTRDREFVLHSWRTHRHEVGRAHWLGPTSDDPTPQAHGPGTEIYRMGPPINGPRLADPTPSPEDCYGLWPLTAQPGPDTATGGAA